MSEAALYRLGQALQADGYRFVTPTPLTHARVNARAGNAQARSIADIFGWSRPFQDGTLPPALLALAQEAGAVARHGDGWRPLLRLSSLEGLLFWHSAYPTEDPSAVFFGPDTYRFAAAVSHLLEAGRPLRRAVDVCCGAGPGACVVARARPGAHVLATDINPAALSLARVNVGMAGLDAVETRHSDLFAALDGAFDLVVSNPPYLADPAERTYRHGGGELGAGLSLAIVEAALPQLAPGGTLLLYTGAAIVNGHDAFRSAVAGRCVAHAVSWEYHEVDPDVFGEELLHGPYVEADRIAAVVLTATRDG